jgi:hypothetical protein
MAPNQKLTCDACGTEFESREQLEQHNKREHAHEAQPKSPLSTETSSPRREDGAAGAQSIE